MNKSNEALINMLNQYDDLEYRIQEYERRALANMVRTTTLFINTRDLQSSYGSKEILLELENRLSAHNQYRNNKKKYDELTPKVRAIRGKLND